MDWSKRLGEVLEITNQRRRARGLPRRSSGRLVFGRDFESKLADRLG